MVPPKVPIVPGPEAHPVSIPTPLHAWTKFPKQIYLNGVLTVCLRTRWVLPPSEPGAPINFCAQAADLVTLAVVSSRRKGWSRAQTSIFIIENQHFLVQMAPEASWPPDVPAGSLEAWISQPGVLSQASSARIPQPGVLSQNSLARNLQPAVSSQSVWGPRWSHFLSGPKILTRHNTNTCDTA